MKKDEGLGPRDQSWIALAIVANHAYSVLVAWGVRHLERLYLAAPGMDPAVFQELLPWYSRVLILLILLNPATLAESARLIREWRRI